jgi:ABC-type polysaccharide/polyol phosphate transport system ATPase subunit
VTAPESAPAVELHGISKRYRLHKAPRFMLGGVRKPRVADKESKLPDELWALRHIDLEVPTGETLGVIGPNGAGKTTLLKLLAQVTVPTEGHAVVRGRVVPLLRLGAGFNPEYSGRNNAFLNAAMLGIPRAAVERRLDDIVELADLERFIDVPVKHYSSGMYIRLAVSVAINLEPDILLADEVLAVGDAEFQARCMNRLADLAGQDGTTILFVSHDLEAVRRLCRRVIRLDHGEIVDEGAPDAVIAGYEEQTRAALAERPEGKGARWVGEKRRVLLDSIEVVPPPGRTDDEVLVDEDTTLRLDFRQIGWALEFEVVVLVEADGHVVFASEGPDTLGTTEPGRYRAEITIPAGSLVARVYDVSVEFRTRKRGKPRNEVFPRALSFRGHGSALDRAAGTGSAARGLVASPLQWQLEALPADGQPVPTPGGEESEDA